MAINGSYKYTTKDSMGLDAPLYEFEWTRTNADRTKQQSTISWTAAASSISEQYATNTVTKVVINGQEVSPSAKSGSFILQHAESQDASFTLSITVTRTTPQIGTIPATRTNAVKSETFVVDKMPIEAKILSAIEFNDTENPVVTYTCSPSVEKLEAYLIFEGDNSSIVKPRDIDPAETSYTFPLTDAEREALCKGIKTGSSRQIRYYLRTTIGGQYYYSQVTKIFRLVDYYPTVSPSVIDVNETTVNLTGNSNRFVKYFSTAQVNTGAKANKGASIVTQVVTNGSKTLEIEDTGSTIGTIDYIESNTFYVRAIDSRNYSASGFYNISEDRFVNYIKLTSSLTLDYLTLAGDLGLTVRGNYFNGTFGAEHNELTFRYFLIEDGDEIGTFGMNADVSYSGNSYTATYTITGLDPEKTYEVYVDVTDALMHAQSNAEAIAATPVFDWGKNDFNHNTSVYLKKNTSLRTIDNDGNDISVLNPCNPNGNLVIGWGQYDNENGDTQVYGNNVNLTAKNTVMINGKPIGGKILWNGALYMRGNQTATLSEAVSKQINGIVLVFSLYRNNNAENKSIHSFFVSKKEVELLPDAPHTFLMAINSGFSVVGAKYVYIRDNAVAGAPENYTTDERNNTTNEASGTNSGITYNNGSFVLRYVIGV